MFTACLEADNAKETLEALAKDPKVKGIRQILMHHPDKDGPSAPRNSEDFLDNEAWRAGFKLLKDVDFSFDALLNPHQYAKAAELVKGQPETTVIINHIGAPQLADLEDPEKAKVYWDGMEKLAECKNTIMKLSGLGERYPKFDENKHIVAALHRIIKLFGVDRCIFASNFPVDLEQGWTADKLFAAFEKLTEQYSDEDRRKLFSLTAKKAYRVD